MYKIGWNWSITRKNKTKNYQKTNFKKEQTKEACFILSSKKWGWGKKAMSLPIVFSGSLFYCNRFISTGIRLKKNSHLFTSWIFGCSLLISAIFLLVSKFQSFWSWRVAYYFTAWEFSALIDCLLLEFEWQQVFLSLQNS